MDAAVVCACQNFTCKKLSVNDELFEDTLIVRNVWKKNYFSKVSSRMINFIRKSIISYC